MAVAGPVAGKTCTGKHGYPCVADIDYSAMKGSDFDALLVPGGFAGGPRPRSGDGPRKLIAFICHAGWVLISAGILRGRRATSTVGIRDDMVNAGALWVNEELVQDGNLVSSRTPADLHVFAKAMVLWLRR